MRSLACLLLLLASCKREGGPTAPPSPTVDEVPDDPVVVNDDGDLVIPAVQRGADTYELHLGKGRATLVLGAEPSIIAHDPARGALALAAFAKWLKVPVPPQTHTQPLQPLSFEIIRMDEHENKAFFSRGAEYAEVYINTPDPQHIVFGWKDEDYAAPLADMLADALRDGPAPARTTSTDPNLETEQPLFSITPIDADVHDPACFATGWVGFVRGAHGEQPVLRPWGGGPARPLCDLRGAVDHVASGLRSPAAFAVVTERDPHSGVISSGDTAHVWSIGPAGCERIAVPADVKVNAFVAPLVSPTGSTIAIAVDGAIVSVDVATRAATRVPASGLVLPYAWDDVGPLFHDLEHHTLLRAAAGKPFESLDRPAITAGPYTITVLADALVVSNGNATRRFQPRFRSDFRAIARAVDEAPPVLGPHRLVLRGSPELVLDLVTLHTRPLGPAGSQLVCASPDGAHALVSVGRDKLAEAATASP